MKPGQIVLVRFPFTDGAASKVRPVLVVSEERYNHGQDVVVLPISSRPAASDPFAYHVDLSLSRFAGAGLKQSSSVKYAKPMTIAKTAVKRRLGTLSSECLEEVRDKLRAVLSRE